VKNAYNKNLNQINQIKETIMKLKSVLVFFCLLILLFARPNQASAVTLNFDELGPDFTLYPSLDYPDVRIRNSEGALQVRDLFPGPPFSVPMVIVPEHPFFPDNLNIAEFTSAVDFVSVVLGDFNEDEDLIFLNAYDSHEVLVASDQFLLPSSLFGGHVLSVSANHISRVEFGGQALDNDTNNSVYFDNFTYRTAPVNGNVIPEPATLSLFSLGLLVNWVFRRKQSA
jgi:hypothetical protein